MRGRIPDVFFDWHVALVRNTRRSRNERAMIRDAVFRGGDWRPGLTFERPSWPRSSSRSST